MTLAPLWLLHIVAHFSTRSRGSFPPLSLCYGCSDKSRKKVSVISCHNRTWPCVGIRSACSHIPTCLPVPTCSPFCDVSLSLTEITRCKSECVFPILTERREDAQLFHMSACPSDYAALGSAGHSFPPLCGHPFTPAGLQRDLLAAGAHTLLSQQQQEGRQAMPPGPTLPF